MQVYCERPMNYGPQDERIMLLLADQAAILLSNSQSLHEARRLSRQLTGALAGRDTIAQAVGVLLGRGATSAEEAFDTLAAAAVQTRRPVEEVARALLIAVTGGSAGSPAR
jgi:AmiR/NasT family two-component response regulator